MWLIFNTSPGGASKPSFCHPSDLPLLILFFSTVDCNSVFICICELPAKHKLFIFIMGQTWHKVDAKNTGYLAEWRLDECMESLEMKCYKSPAWKETFNEWHFFPLQGWAALVLLLFFLMIWKKKSIHIWYYLLKKLLTRFRSYIFGIPICKGHCECQPQASLSLCSLHSSVTRNWLGYTKWK